jgi:hypothetical protein
MNTQATVTTPTTRYFAFDRKTGRILGAHSRFSVDAKGHVRMNYDELTKLFAGDASIIADLTDQDAGNLDFLEVSGADTAASTTPVMVDVAHRTIVAQPSLVLLADKRELLGDGADTVTIRIEVQAQGGHVVHDFHGAVKVSTTRGRLSARGGLVEARHGVASLTLTSVAETVSQVRVQARALHALCAPGSLTLEFM